MKSNTFFLSMNKGVQSGSFNIYQGSNGGIYLSMSHFNTLLLQNQISDLQIQIEDLRNFDKARFAEFYSMEIPTKNEALCVSKVGLQEGMINLPSVGSVIDTNLMVYPAFLNGTADLEAGGRLEDCCEDWWDNLDSDDRAKVQQLQNKLAKSVSINLQKKDDK